MAAQDGPRLVGRRAEMERVTAWLDGIRGGTAALLIRGEAGIGKTALWDAAVGAARAAGARVLVARPAEAELPMGYAALGDLLGPFAGAVMPRLPAPQAGALASALLLADGEGAAEPAHIGRAVLSALQALAADGPLVVAVDDVQWLDPATASALSFAIRRLGESPVGVAVTLRDGHDEPLGVREAFGSDLVDVPVTGLTIGAVGALLRSRVDPGLTRRRLVGIHERSAGNPFYALQLATVAGSSLPSSLQELVRRRLDDAPADANDALDLAAVRGPFRPGAADQAAVDAAVAAGLLVEDGETIRFIHPLFAAGAYERIPPGRRRALHERAAKVAGTLEDRARHLALAATGPDAPTAAILEQAAAAARSRGAPQSAIELADQAVRLTPDDAPDDRARRLMDQADYLVLSADEPSARAIVERLIEEGVRGATRVRAKVHAALLESTPGAAVADLEEAVREPHDDGVLKARALAQLAWQRGAWLGDLEPAFEEARESVRLAEALGDPGALVSALTTAGLLSSVAGREGADVYFRRALEIHVQHPRSAADHTPRLAFAHERWWRGDYVTARALMADERRAAEDEGDGGLLMRLNVFGADLATYDGRWAEADALIAEALVDARDWWRAGALTTRAILRARRGDPAALEDVAAVQELPVGRGDPVFVAAGEFATGLLAAADGRLAEAARLVARLPEVSDQSGSRGPDLAQYSPDAAAVLVEAGQPEAAERIAERIDARRIQLEPWGPAASSLIRGLVALAGSQPGDSLPLLTAAIETFEEVGAPWLAGQSRLGRGSALRRLGRRREAAADLEVAVAAFTALGAVPAQRRAEDELRRARPRPRHDDQLTAAEIRVAALVADGKTNREVAAALFTTVATVEAHLTRIYGKVGVRSRSELTRLVAAGAISLDGQSDPEMKPAP
jgi:DNA-binding CsgD family transcriptional regulator